MLNNKIKYILILFIILSLSMNAFSATNFTDNSSDASPQSSSDDNVEVDNQTDDSQNNGGTDNSNNTNDNGTKPGRSTFGGNSTFNFNGTGRGGNNSTGIDIASIIDMFMKMMGGNETNTTNETPVSNVSDVPKVVTSTSYVPVPQLPSIGGQSSHIVERLRDNKTISEGNVLTLGDLNKLYDSDFRNGHLLVYVDGKLVFNEITAGDLSTPIFWITNDYLGQHQIKIEFTPNGNSNTNNYTEDVLII